jgi:hypothetical protein
MPQEDGPEEWPPLGFSTFYTVTEKLAGQPEREYHVLLPSSFSKIDLSTIRVGRHGGPNDEDMRYRDRLYRLLGEITVASGHAEAAMKRLLLVLKRPDEAHFAEVDETWTSLTEQLRKECDGSDHRRSELEALLNWADEKKVKVRRDNAIHAYWWIYDGVGARRSRFARRTDGSIIDATLDDVAEDAGLIFEYANRLDELIGYEWMTLRLEGPFRPRPT